MCVHFICDFFVDEQKKGCKANFDVPSADDVQGQIDNL